MIFILFDVLHIFTAGISKVLKTKCEFFIEQ